MEMVKNSPKDCYGTVQTTTLTILSRLQQVLQMESHIQSQVCNSVHIVKDGNSDINCHHVQSDRVQFNDLQSLLCATLQSVLRKVDPQHAPQVLIPQQHRLSLSTNILALDF